MNLLEYLCWLRLWRLGLNQGILSEMEMEMQNLRVGLAAFGSIGCLSLKDHSSFVLAVIDPAEVGPGLGLGYQSD